MVDLSDLSNFEFCEMIRPRKVILGLLIVCVGYLYIVWSPESGGKDPEEDPTEEVYW